MKFLDECSKFEIFNFDIAVISYHCNFMTVDVCGFPFPELLIIHSTKVHQCVFRTVTATFYIRAHINSGVNIQFPWVNH